MRTRSANLINHDPSTYLSRHTSGICGHYKSNKVLFIDGEDRTIRFTSKSYLTAKKIIIATKKKIVFGDDALRDDFVRLNASSQICLAAKEIFLNKVNIPKQHPEIRLLFQKMFAPQGCRLISQIEEKNIGDSYKLITVKSGSQSLFDKIS